MSKNTENILLVPGEAGWEIWSATPAGFQLVNATNLPLPGELTDLPSGDVTLLFPVKSITAVPMRVTSDDESLFGDLAALHAERLGLRPDPMAGQLTDLFIISREPENTALLSVLLRSPGDGDLPTRGPKEFDLSARAFPLPGNSLAVWKELGRWVFALSHQGNLAYCQATPISTHAPGDDLVREIRLALIQLSMQGIELKLEEVHLWTSDAETPRDHFTVAFQIRPQVAPRPAPVLPDPRSKLLPADVRAARRAAAKKRSILLGIAAVAVLYLGLIGYLGYGLWKESSDTKKLTQQAQAAAPDGQAYMIHRQKWDELSLATNIKNSPVDILYRVTRCAPPNTGLRLKTADISAAEVKIIGEAPQPGPVNEFSKKIQQSNELMDFKWQMPPPTQTNTGWQFSYNGTGPENP